MRFDTVRHIGLLYLAKLRALGLLLSGIMKVELWANIRALIGVRDVNEPVDGICINWPLFSPLG